MLRWIMIYLLLGSSMVVLVRSDIKELTEELKEGVGAMFTIEFLQGLVSLIHIVLWPFIVVTIIWSWITGEKEKE